MNPEKWRKSFSDAYANRLRQRLSDMAAKNEANAGEAGVLALVSDQDRIKQQFYTLFPELNPQVRKRQDREAQEAEEARWNALTPEQQQAVRTKQEKEDLKWSRRYAKQGSYYDDSGWTAGTRAADKADLGQNKIGSSDGRELE
jgi:hypothetical protein